MSKENQLSVMQILRETKPAQIAELEVVKDRFISIHNQLTGSENGEMVYHKEVFNYKKLLAETPTLRDCSQLSLYGCFLDLNVNGLSLEQGTKPDCYITPKSFKVGQDDKGKDVWEKRATLSISPYGELKMRMRANQIKYVDNPVVVYDCDTFKVGLNANGKMVVKDYEATVPTPKGSKIIACFVRIERPDGSFEMPYLDDNAVQRLRGYSNRQNKGDASMNKANALYTSNGGQIDTGFLKAKTIKHAFSSYPKVETGKFAKLESEIDEEITPIIDYGIPEDEMPKDEFTEALEEEAENKEEIETVQYETVEDGEPEF